MYNLASCGGIFLSSPWHNCISVPSFSAHLLLFQSRAPKYICYHVFFCFCTFPYVLCVSYVVWHMLFVLETSRILFMLTEERALTSLKCGTDQEGSECLWDLLPVAWLCSRWSMFLSTSHSLQNWVHRSGYFPDLLNAIYCMCPLLCIAFLLSWWLPLGRWIFRHRISTLDTLVLNVFFLMKC